MKRYPLYIFDLDGTLFRGNDPVPGAAEALARLRAEGSGIRYLTNNSTKTRAAFIEKLSGMGFEAHPSEVFTSALGAGEKLRGAVSSAFVVGELGLFAALREAGLRTSESVEPVDALVVGLCRHFDYRMLNDALQAGLDPSVRFVATNRDATYPMEGGRLIPGAGSIVAAVASCLGREPEVVGKPEPFLIEWILREAGIASADALVVGDRVDTDLEAGRRAGCPVHLVLTGVTGSAPEGVSWSEDVAALVV